MTFNPENLKVTEHLASEIIDVEKAKPVIRRPRELATNNEHRKRATRDRFFVTHSSVAPDNRCGQPFSDNL